MLYDMFGVRPVCQVVRLCVGARLLPGAQICAAHILGGMALQSDPK